MMGMPMVPFIERFPEAGPKETRTIIVPAGLHLPEGEYGFFEFYCNEPACDCRRAIIQVLRPETGWRKVWASIGYGWEPEQFYRRWSSATPEEDLKGPYLDPLLPQSSYSDELLDAFRQIIKSPDYVRRLERHYFMFRDTVSSKSKAVLRHKWKRRKT